MVIYSFYVSRIYSRLYFESRLVCENVDGYIENAGDSNRSASCSAAKANGRAI